jgi:hypothetical protein
MKKKTQPIWHLFVEKSLDILADGGYLVMVHPSGWRNVSGVFKETQNQLKKRKMLYLEIHSRGDGFRTFGAGTRYEFYCIENIPNDNFKTKIKGQDGKITYINISELQFIPNAMINEILDLVAKNNENTVEILRNSSYHHQRTHMKREQTKENIYPCVYTISKSGVISLFYSSIKNKGHFDIPKMIFSNNESIYAGSIIDYNGEYGLTEFSFGIIDDVENLDNIKKAFDSKIFREMMKYCEISTNSINAKVIAIFRKNFYKDFL